MKKIDKLLNCLDSLAEIDGKQRMKDLRYKFLSLIYKHKEISVIDIQDKLDCDRQDITRLVAEYRESNDNHNALLVTSLDEIENKRRVMSLTADGKLYVEAALGEI